MHSSGSGCIQASLHICLSILCRPLCGSKTDACFTSEVEDTCLLEQHSPQGLQQ